jgi:hypothetical protein
MDPHSKTITYLNRFEKLIPVLLFLLFLAASIPGISWGTPDIWNPDELVGRVDLALGGEIQFDETEPDYNYPSLPKYVMYGVGKIVYGLGYTRTEFIISARLLSALLGGLVVLVIYYLARRIGATTPSALLAGLLMIASGVIPFNARFGHNDMYLLLFITLCVYFLVNYQTTKNRLWLYGSFYMVGLAASSKYTGGSMILLPIFVLVIINWMDVRTDPLGSIEQLFIGVILSVLGYGTGTPKALLWTSFYFKRVFPALARYPLYGLQPNSRIGLIGQWPVFESAVGAFIYYLFLIAFGWFVLRLILSRLGRAQISVEKQNIILILLIALVIFDLPFMISVNYIPRYFIPFVPFFSLLAALFVEQMVKQFQERGHALAITGISIVLFLGLGYSFLRVVSTVLLFVHDARTPASEYLKTLRPGTVIEYTLYPPIIPKGQFAITRNYPIFFLKYPGDRVPTNKPYDYNVGEAGLLERGVDYLVIDSFTYSRFKDEFICKSNPVECNFFSRLLSGETNYRLLKDFKYALPPYLPRVSLAAVNPEMRVYEIIR